MKYVVESDDSILRARERTQNVWERLTLVALFLVYAAATVIHADVRMIAVLFFSLAGAGVIYYLPMRLGYWLFTGSGEITNRFLLWLPLRIIVVLGILLMITGVGE